VEVAGGIPSLSPIAAALVKNTSVKSLNLRGNQIASLAPLSGNLGCVTHLYLGNNMISNVSTLADHLKNPNCKLKVLHLDGNAIVDVEALGQALSTNQTLNTLILDDNQISNVESLGQALRENKKLQALYLKSNAILDIEALAAGVKTNRTLQELSLRNNQLKDVINLVAILKNNHRLKYISLDQNPLGAPKLFWGPEACLGFRTPPVLDVCVCLRDFRARKRDYRAFASTVGLGRKQRRWMFDDLVISRIQQYLWNPTLVLSEMELKVGELFGRSEDATEVLIWLMKDLSSNTHPPECHATKPSPEFL